MTLQQSVEDIYPLSPMQQGMLFHSLYDPHAGLHVWQMSCRLSGPLDRIAFERALRRLIERHATLRTSFAWEGLDQPLQIVDREVPLPLVEEDWSGLCQSERQERLQSLLEQDLHQAFDLTQAPLLRLRLAREGENRHRLLWSLHLLLLDGWSTAALLGELFLCYEAFRLGQEPRLGAPRRYRDYIAWLSRQDGAAAERFFREELSGFTVPTPLPGDRGRHPGDGAPAHFEEGKELSEEETAALQAFARDGKLTLNTLIQGGWALLLARLCGERDVVFGATVSGRPPELPDVESMVGPFINTLPVRAVVDWEVPALDWLRALQSRHAEARQFQHTPLVEIQGMSGVPRGVPLFDSLVVFENYPVDASLRERRGSLGIDEVRIREVTSFPLALRAQPGPRLSLHLSCDGARFDRATAAGLLGRLQLILAALSRDGARPLGELPWLSEAERRQLVSGWNRHDARFERGTPLHRLFEAVAARAPDLPAVTCGEETLTYGELDRRANRLARHLRRLGVGPETRVGLFVDRSARMIEGLLGILKAGGAYVPLDPDVPAERLAFVFADARLGVVVTEESLVPRLLSSPGTARVLLDGEGRAIAGEEASPLEGGAEADNAAYVIYTSGSTGRPKGVVVTNGEVARLFTATRSWFGFGPGDVWTLFHSVAFDFSVWEIWGALAHGGRLVVVPFWISRSPESFYTLLSGEGVTVLNQTPSAFRQLVQAEGALPSPRPLALRYVVFGGEALDMASLAPWFERHGDERPLLVNMYGITETTVHVTYRPVTAADLTAGSRIGGPIPDLQIYLTDERIDLVPPLAAGEILVGGAGLARGYLDRPELTAERFVPDPFGTEPGARLYRSGDQARFLPSEKDLEYLGRIDQQVKIRGFRIELGEIQACLAAHPEIRDAAVVAREGETGKRLVAYVVPERAETPPATAELRAFLARRLPDYMLPSAFVALPGLPLTRNGKLDRAALPDPALATETPGEIVLPATPVEEALAEVWSSVLGVRPVGVCDSFFHLGGDSILSIQVVSRARERGIDLTLQQIFERPTIRELARGLEDGGGSVPEAGPEPLSLVSPEDRERLPAGVEDAYPLARLQAGMLFHSELSPESAVYHDVFSAHLRCRFDEELLRDAVGRLVALHPVLRTSFDLTGFHGPMQIVHREVALPLAVDDLRGLPAGEQEAAVSRWLEEERHRGFDWTWAPLVRFHIHRRSEETFQFTLSFHHSVLDGWSAASLQSTLFRLYLSLLSGREEPGEPPPAAFRELVELERAALASRETEEFWTRSLAGATASLLPRWPQTPGAHRSKHEVAVAFDEAAVGDLRAVARRADVPMKSALLALHVRAVSFLTGQPEVVTGLVANGRPERDGGERALGLFLNTLPFRLRLGPESWTELARAAFHLEREMLPHRRYPLAEIQARTGGQALFETSFNFVHFHVYQGLQDLSDLQVLELAGYEETNFTLGASFQLDPEGERLLLRLNFSNAEIAPDQGTWIGEVYRRALALMTAAPEARAAEVSLLSDEERHQILAEGSGRAVPFPGDLCLHHLFEAQAARAPGAVAVECGGDTLTYAELERRAEHLARHLRRLGVGPEVPVGIALERSPDMAAALLGVLKAGGAALPIDPEYPPERIALLLEDARPSLLLTRSGLDALAEEPEPEGETRPRPALPAATAVILYTSGSTGRPKGVTLSHRGLVNRMLWAQRAYPLQEEDRVLQSASFSFDFALWELFGAWLAGARAVLAEPGGHRDSSYLAELIAERGITVAHFVPSMLRVFLEEDLARCDRLRLVFSGGEALPAELRDRFFARTGAALHNQYGPTEASIDVTHWVCRPGAPGRSVPLGHPIDNTRIYLLDRALQPVPAGTSGELYVGGENLARGYLGRPDLTAERFLPDPWSGISGERLYRTGDLARQLPGGALEFLGRIDHQVKVRGFRIEIEEIEAEIACEPGVREAAVAVRGEGADRRLVAYVAAGPSVAAATLREALRRRLPEFMVPGAWVILPDLPRSPNGKIDRRALPEPEDATGAAMELALPRTPLEELVAEVWADVLGRDGVGIDEDFFALGGHSLLATRVVSRLRNLLGIDLPLRALFEAPRVAELAARIEAALQGGAGLPVPPISCAPRDGELPLSFSQQRLWLLDRLEPGNPAYNVPAAVRLTGRLDRAALAASLGGVVARHEVLRTTFPEAGGRPVQTIAPPRPGPLPLIDLGGLPAADRAAEARRLATAEALRPFDLARGPLLRSSLLSLGSEEHVLLLSLHHIVSDGWSTGVLVREMGALYEAASTGEPASLPDLPVQYADYACWQRSWLSGETLEQQLGYWRRELAGAPSVLDLPTDRPRPAVRTPRGTRAFFLVAPETVAGLTALGRRSGTTLFMTLFGGFLSLLRRYTGADDLCVGTPIAGRRHQELEGLIGFFVNTLVLRSRLAGDPVFEELLANVRGTALDAYTHQDLPFEKLVEELQPERSTSRQPLAQVMFALQNAPRAEIDLPGLTLSPQPFDNPTVKFDLALTFLEAGSALAAGLDCSLDLYDPATASRMGSHLEILLGEIARAPGLRLSELPLISPPERHQILVEWNETSSGGAAFASVVEQLEKRALRSPDAVALLWEGGASAPGARLTYRQLDQAANRLAHRLISSGVGPEVRVGLLIERSPELVVGILGILKAGGAYVPLDPGYPPARLRFLQEDSAAPVLVTRSSLLDRLPGYAGRTLLLESLGEGEGDDRSPARRPSPGDLAYLIYTSGTTGTPKAVMVEHGNLAHTLRACQRAFGFGPADRMPILAPFSFDIFLFELFGPLLAGGTAVLVDLRPAPDLDRLADLLADSTLLHAVPALMRQIVDTVLHQGSGPERYARLRSLFVGGDTVPQELLVDLRKAFPRARPWVLYGPTEGTIVCTSHAVLDEPGQGWGWIGRPLDGAVLHLLDRDRNPVPIGVPGEVYIGGPCVARGYWNREELTAERFLILGGERFYRSGDLARRLPDGTLVFLGRSDDQVKVRGFRVELGEIETVLARHPAVAEAAVLAREDGHGHLRLVAYLVPLPEASVDGLGPKLRTWLSERLPEWMVPSAFLALDAFPLTAHGKVDRRALPAPGLERLEIEGDYVAPRGPVEETLATIWEELLGVERLGAHDDFFTRGGHSLLATQAVSRMRTAFRLEIPLRAFFAEPTVAGLAAWIEQARTAGGEAAPPPLTPVPRDGRLPLSFAQQRLWVLDEMQPGRADYNIPFALRITGRLDRGALAASLVEIARRHEALRTTFALAEGEPVQVIHEPVDSPPPLVDVSGLPPASRTSEAGRLTLAEARAPFDLGRGPLLRATLLQTGEEEHVLLLTLHHIVSDAWSIGVLVREIGALYGAFSSGRPSPLPALPVQYADFAVWQRRWLEGAPLEAQLAYWERQLADLTVLELPTDRPRPPVPSLRGRRLPFVLPPEVSRSLRELAVAERTTLFIPLLATFVALLHQMSGQDDVVVGTDVAGRTREEIEGLIGFFVNQLVLRVDAGGDPAFRDLLGRARETALTAYAHQDVPFERLVAALEPERDPSRSPLFQVKLVLQNTPAESLELPGLTLGLLPIESDSAKYDLLVSVIDGQSGLAGTLEYNRDLFDDSTAERLLARFQSLLKLAAHRPDARLSELAAALAQEREKEFRTSGRQLLKKVERTRVRGVGLR